MKKYRIRVTGQVQGVGFRFTTQMLAEELGIYGIVRNEADGSVYIEAVGETNAMTMFIQRLELGPSPHAYVKHLEYNEDSSVPDYTNFRVVY